MRLCMCSIYPENPYEVQDMQPQLTGLVRKQFLISPANETKLNSLAKLLDASASDVVRQAIEAFDPEAATPAEIEALIKFARQRVQQSSALMLEVEQRVTARLAALSTYQGHS